MRLQIVWPGKTREAYLQNGIEDFCNRLKRFVRLKIRIVREMRCKGGDAADPRIIEEEGRRLLAALDVDSLLVALDSGGREMDSGGLARLISQWESQGRACVTFIIGGALGLSHQVLKRADEVLSLSKMTFTHEMTRLILLEQIYRAYTIKAGMPYHK